MSKQVSAQVKKLESEFAPMLAAHQYVQDPKVWEVAHQNDVETLQGVYKLTQGTGEKLCRCA